MHPSCGLQCLPWRVLRSVLPDCVARSSPPHKRQRSSPSNVPAEKTEPEMVPAQPPPPIAPKTTLNTLPPPLPSTPNPRKRRASRSPAPQSSPLGSPPGPTETASAVPVSSLLSEGSVKKRGRTNTPWTAAEEQRLKQMRDAGNSWSEIAKVCPSEVV